MGKINMKASILALKNFAILFLSVINVWVNWGNWGSTGNVLAIAPYVFFIFPFSLALFILSISSFKRDSGLQKGIDILGLIISIGFTFITIVSFIYAYYFARFPDGGGW